MEGSFRLFDREFKDTSSSDPSVDCNRADKLFDSVDHLQKILQRNNLEILWFGLQKQIQKKNQTNTKSLFTH